MSKKKIINLSPELLSFDVSDKGHNFPSQCAFLFVRSLCHLSPLNLSKSHPFPSFFHLAFYYFCLVPLLLNCFFFFCFVLLLVSFWHCRVARNTTHQFFYYSFWFLAGERISNCIYLNYETSIIIYVAVLVNDFIVPLFVKCFIM